MTTRKLTIAYEAADASAAGSSGSINPSDRFDALYQVVEARHNKTRRIVSTLLRWIVYAGAVITSLVLAFIVGYILVNGVPYLTPSLFEWEYDSTNVSLMAVPVGVGSAIYLVEYAKRGSRFVQIVRTTTETLQGIPSIIYGLFGLLFFVTALQWGLSLLAGACTLAIMVLPVVMRTTEEALLAVPDAYREGGFGLGGVSFYVEEGQRASQIQVLSQGPLNTGALVLLGMDGDRFVNESVPVRHGHMYMNGTWHNPIYPDKMWTVYDQTQADLISEAQAIPEAFRSQVVEASSLEELAEKTGMKLDQLKATITNFNDYAKQGTDEQYHREAETMRPFDGTKYYAFPVKAEILNTQGGPKRNENAEILHVNGNPIPHLYSAGEMGGITSEHYQGGTNLAECIIFGQIAGKNAAAAKEALPEYTLAPQVESTPTKLGEVTDLNKETNYETAANEYIGEGTGMGGKLVVKVTMDGDKIANVEILEHSESETISDPAIEQLPKAIMEANGTEVDTISGATVTSKAIIEAVNQALAQVK